MKRFFIKLSLFLFPLIAFFSTCLFVLIKSKETASVKYFCSKQQDPAHKYLVGLAYSNPSKALKLQTANLRKAPVMALGTSRTMLFRSAFFKDFNTFYNAGGGVAQIKHCRIFLKHLDKEAIPKIIILGLDQNFFNAAWDKENDVSEDHLKEEYINKHDLVPYYHDEIKSMIKGYAAGKFSLAQLFDQKVDVSAAGLNAIVNDNGYRNDGSWQYGKIINDPENPASFHDFGFSTTFNSIKTGTLRYKYGEAVFGPLVSELDSFLAVCNQLGIHVIGFLPPYAHQVWMKMKEHQHEYGFMWELYDKINPVFSSHGYVLHDFSDLATLGCTDKQVFDGDHASEIAYAKMLTQMAANDHVLQPYCDTISVNQKLTELGNSNYILFTDEDY